MKSREEISEGIAFLLKDLRTRHGLSKNHMADRLYMDPHTWAKYESGQSSPGVTDFIWIFYQLGESPLKRILNMIYPDVYGRSDSTTIDEMRKASVHYTEHIASDHVIEVWNYLNFYNHGSDIEPQLQELLMIDHLPMLYRYAVAEMVLTFWELASAKGEIINGECMPDVDLFKYALEKGKEATIDNRNSYSTSIKK